MEVYQISSTLVPAAQLRDDVKQVVVLKEAERQGCPLKIRLPERPSGRFCTAQEDGGGIYGTMALPNKVFFGYTVTAELVCFVDDSGAVERVLQKLSASKRWSEPGVGRFLYDFWGALLEEDLRKLEAQEEKITKMESAVLNDPPASLHQKLMFHRRQVISFLRCYTQFDDVLDRLLENGNGLFTPEELRLFRLLQERVGRLRSTAQNLREYCLQVWELFQAEVDLRQNRIMKTLTTVTVVFSPITLLVGWYGMNFAMPELGWSYGYVFVIALGVVVTALAAWLCKRKKFW